MKLGFVSAILPELSTVELFEFAAGYGFDCIEVMCWPIGKAERRYAGVTHLDVSDFSRDDADRMNELTARTGVEISGLGYYPNPLSPVDDESKIAIAHLRRVISAAATLGIPVVNTFVGRDWKKSVEQNWSRFLQVWKPMIELAEDKGVKIGIENCPMFFTRDEWPGGKNLKTTPSIWRKMYNDIESDYFGLNFDPSHFVWQKMDYNKAVLDFSHKMFHIHAKDAILDKDRLDDVGLLAYPNEFHTPKIPGRGDVDWEKFIGTLNGIGYNGAVCIEIEDREFEGSLESRMKSLELSANHLRKFIPE